MPVVGWIGVWADKITLDTILKITQRGKIRGS